MPVPSILRIARLKFRAGIRPPARLTVHLTRAPGSAQVSFTVYDHSGAGGDACVGRLQFALAGDESAGAEPAAVTP